MAKKKISRKTFDPEIILDENFDYNVAKSPPNAVDIEQKVLGAILIDNLVYSDAMQILSEKHFYKTAHRFIFNAMVALDHKKEPIDHITLKEELSRMGHLEDAGGVDYIVDLTLTVSTSANVEYYSRIIYEKYVLRELIHIASTVVEKSFDSTVNAFSLIGEAENKLLDISNSLSKKKAVSLKDSIDDLIAELGDQRANRTSVTGIQTGYTRLDDLTAGLQKSELIIVAGRPSHGKTALAVNIARNAAVEHGKSVGIFSLEMSSRELILRLLSGEAKVDGKRLKTNKSSHEEWQRVVNTYHRLKQNIYIDDSSELTILELRAKAKRMKVDYDLDFIIVDYLQLVRGAANFERRDLEVAEVSRGLKALAKDLDIPVVACAQLNRGIEQRGKEKRPQLADLRESGALEQDADVVIFVHRPVMNVKPDPLNPEYQNLLRKAEIIIGKQRNGPVDDLELVFVTEYARFENPITPPVIDIPVTSGEYEKSDISDNPF